MVFLENPLQFRILLKVSVISLSGGVNWLVVLRIPPVPSLKFSSAIPMGSKRAWQDGNGLLRWNSTRLTHGRFTVAEFLLHHFRVGIWVAVAVRAFPAD